MSDIRYARTPDGLSLAYRVDGDGPLDVVFVPGFVSHLELLWEEPDAAAFFEAIGAFARVITFDRRGQGLSDRPGKPPTLEEGGDDIRAVMDAAGSERAALFAVSEGGPMSILCAASFPDRVAALVLWGTYARVLRDDDYPMGATQEQFDRLRELTETLWGGPIAVSVWAPSRAEDPEFRSWWGRFLRQSSSPQGAVDLLSLYQDLDVRDVLSAIAVPTLVMARSGDRLTPTAMGRYLAEHIEGARFVEVPGRDHLVATENPHLIVGEVEEFLTGQRYEREPDRVLATVMFTDIVGSTEQAATLGDREWRRLSPPSTGRRAEFAARAS